MPSMIEARTKIAKEYCRHVVVIDDQCQPEAENHERYGLFATECEAAGIACNIFGYFGRRTFASAEDIVASHELALRSDVVVLDWHLGEDRGESAAIELLAALKNDRGVHIVFIDTRHAQQDVADALEAELGLTRFDGEPGDGPDDPNEIEEVSLDEGGDSPLLKSDDGGLVVAVRTHDGDRDAASGVLLDQVRDLLRRAFQTHLHWAGLEFVSRSRELMPQVLRSLPNDSDPCIIHQLLHSHSDQVISAQVAEVFGDEIQRFLEARPLESVSGAVLIDDLNTRMSAYCAKESAFMDLSKDGCPGFATVIESIRNKQAAQPPNGLTKQETADLESLDKARNLWNGTPSYEDIASAYAPCISNKGERCPYFPYKGKAGAHLASAQLISRVTESAAPDFRPWAALRETCLLTPTNYPLPGMLLVKKNWT